MTSDNTGYGTDTCVINLEGTNDWTLTHPLPAYNYYLRMITVDNRVFMIGNISCYKVDMFKKFIILGGSNEEYEDTIYELDKETGEWMFVSNLLVGREYHAVSAVNINDLWQYCQTESQNYIEYILELHLIDSKVLRSNVS